MLLLISTIIISYATARTVMNNPWELISDKMKDNIYFWHTRTHQYQWMRNLNQTCQGTDDANGCGECYITFRFQPDGYPSTTAKRIGIKENAKVVVKSTIAGYEGETFRGIHIHTNNADWYFLILQHDVFAWEDYFNELAYHKNACELRQKVEKLPDESRFKHQVLEDIPEVMRRLKYMEKEIMIWMPNGRDYRDMIEFTIECPEKQIMANCDNCRLQFTVDSRVNRRIIPIDDEFLVQWKSDMISDEYRYFYAKNLDETENYGYFRISTIYIDYWKIYFDYLSKVKQKCELSGANGLEHMLLETPPLQQRLVEDIRLLPELKMTDVVFGNFEGMAGAVSIDHIRHKCSCQNATGSCAIFIGLYGRNDMAFDVGNGDNIYITFDYGRKSDLNFRQKYKYFTLQLRDSFDIGITPMESDTMLRFRISGKYDFLWRRYFDGLQQKQSRCKLQKDLEDNPSLKEELMASEIPNLIEMQYQAEILKSGYHNADVRGPIKQLLYVANMMMIIGDLGLFATHGSGAYDDIIEQLYYEFSEGNKGSIPGARNQYELSRIHRDRKLDLSQQIAGIAEKGTVLLSATSAVVWMSCLAIYPPSCLMLAAAHAKHLTLWQVLHNGFTGTSSVHTHLGHAAHIANGGKFLSLGSTMIWNYEQYTVGTSMIFRSLHHFTYQAPTNNADSARSVADKNEEGRKQDVLEIIKALKENKKGLLNCAQLSKSHRSVCIEKSLAEFQRWQSGGRRRRLSNTIDSMDEEKNGQCLTNTFIFCPTIIIIYAFML